MLDIKIFKDANNKESSIQILITRMTYKSKGSAMKVTYKKHAQTWRSQHVMTTHVSQEWKSMNKGGKKKNKGIQT